MRIFKKFWPILFLAAIFLIVFYKVFFLGQVFIEGDNFHLNIPEKYFFVQQILQGHLPLWNPYLFLGIPYLADFNLGTLNPTNLIYFLFPMPRALTLLTICDFFGLSVGMYLLLRNFKLAKISSVLGAVVMSLSGMPFVLLGNMTFMQVIVYIPFLFLLVRKLCQKKTFMWLLLLVLLQFFQFIAGHPQETYYTMLFVACYLLIFLEIPWKRRIGITALYLLFPLLLSSVQLLPFLEYVQHANRPVGSVGYAGWGGLSLPLLPTFLLPTFYGSHIDGTWWGPQQILVGFMGIPTLVLIFVGMRFAKFSEKLFVIGGFLVSFILAFGKTTPLFYLFYYLIPGWKLFRAPSGILVFFTFFAALLAAFGLEYVAPNTKKFLRLGKVLTVVGFLLTVLFGSMYISANRSGFWRNLLIALQQHTHQHILRAILFYDTIKIQQMFQGIVWNVVFVGVLIFLTGIVFAFSKKIYTPLFLLLLTVVGFFVVNPKIVLFAPISYYDTAKNISPFLKPSEQGEYRILSIPVNLHQERQHLPPADFFYKEGQANLLIHQYDNNIESGLYQVGGYVSLVPTSFAQFIGAKDAATNVTNIDFSQVSEEKLSLASVRYIISHEPIQHYANTALHLISSAKGKAYIYENKTALPRVYIKENPATAVTWNNNEADHLELSATVTKPSHLIITDWYYPGWNAYVSGRKAPITAYLSTFQEVAIPKGKSQIKIVYQPTSMTIGLMLSLLGTFLWGVLFGRFQKRHI